MPASQALAGQLASVAIDPRLENSLVAAIGGPERKATEQLLLSEKKWYNLLVGVHATDHLSYQISTVNDEFVITLYH